MTGHGPLNDLPIHYLTIPQTIHESVNDPFSFAFASFHGLHAKKAGVSRSLPLLSTFAKPSSSAHALEAAAPQPFAPDPGLSPDRNVRSRYSGMPVPYLSSAARANVINCQHPSAFNPAFALPGLIRPYPSTFIS